MPLLTITVEDPPTSWEEHLAIKLVLQTKKGFADGIPDEKGLTFQIPYEFRVDRSGGSQPTGDAVQRQPDGRRFVYLTWFSVGGPHPVSFRRLKVFFDKIPGYGTNADLHVFVQGRDRKGGPACATATVLPQFE